METAESPPAQDTPRRSYSDIELGEFLIHIGIKPTLKRCAFKKGQVLCCFRVCISLRAQTPD